jgi:hypothetical protein
MTAIASALDHAAEPSGVRMHHDPIFDRYCEAQSAATEAQTVLAHAQLDYCVGRGPLPDAAMTGSTRVLQVRARKLFKAAMWDLAEATRAIEAETRRHRE